MSGTNTKLSCKQDGAKLECDQIPNMDEGVEYELLFSDPCDPSSIATTEIKVKKEEAVVTTIKPTLMTLAGGDSATTTCGSITSVEITVDTELNKDSYTMKLGTTEFTCEKSVKILTCTGKLEVANTYSLTEIKEATDTEIFDYSEFTTQLTIKASPLGSNDNPKFTITLSSSTATTSLYSSLTDNTKTISCTKTDATLSCAPNADMENTGDYPLYYTDACGTIKPAGITIKVNKSSLPSLTPSNIAFSGGSQCSIIADTYTIDFTFPSSITGSFSNIAVISGGTPVPLTSCSIDDNILSCSAALSAGSYTLSTMDSSNYSLELDAIKAMTLTVTANPFGTLSSTVTVGEGNLDITLALSSPKSFDLYVGKDESKKMICLTTNTNLKCTTTDALMDKSGSYDIYWKNTCGDFVKIENFSVIKKYKEEVVIESFSLSKTESQSCTTIAFNAFFLTTLTDVTITGTGTNIMTVVIVNGENPITVPRYAGTGKIITCSGIASNLINGLDYHLQTVSHNDYKFTYPDNTIKFESIANPLNIQETSGVTNFEINKSQLSFELTLAADASKPTLYLGNDAQNEIQCVLDSPKLTCTFDSISDVTDSKIYYRM